MRWKTSWQTSGRASELRVRYEAFLEEHQADYRKLYDRVDVELGEDLSAGLPTSRRLDYGAEGVDDPSLYGLYLQYSRYLIIAGSRLDSQALNLQGIWNDTVMPPWSSNYTNNINVEMNYWPAETGNLSECHLPLTGDFAQRFPDHRPDVFAHPCSTHGPPAPGSVLTARLTGTPEVRIVMRHPALHMIISFGGLSSCHGKLF